MKDRIDKQTDKKKGINDQTARQTEETAKRRSEQPNE